MSKEYPPVQGRALLPPNSTPLEKVLADVLYPSELNPEELLGTLWDADNCPIEILPYLAYAVSVDVWNPNWPERTKRAVIKASPEVHRTKGTVKAVRLSLEALGVSFKMTEWWEASPKEAHGTFSVVALVNDHFHGDLPLLNEKIQREIQRAVTASKPKSRTFSFSMGVQTVTGLGIKSGFSQSVASIHRVDLLRPIAAVMGLGIKSGFSELSCTHRGISAKPRENASSCVSCLSGMSSIGLSIAKAIV